MATDTAVFDNTRTRLQRLKDAKMFTGWVSELGDGLFRVKISGGAAVEPGDVFGVEVYGSDAVGTFEATAQLILGAEVTMALRTGIRYRPTTESVRISVSGVFAQIAYAGSLLNAEIKDISATGVGVVCSQSLPSSANIGIRMMTPSGAIACIGEVRYSRPDPDTPGSFRVGIKLGEMGRLERARWLRMVDGYVA